MIRRDDEGVEGLRGVHHSVETLHAAAAAIAAAGGRADAASPPRRRWMSCFRVSSCFGSQRQERRISDAIVVPNPAHTQYAPVPENPNHSLPLMLPFVAPPPSPASSLPRSEAASSSQSPAVPISASSYSPIGPASIFAIGPYYHETQLVSPPVFSSFTTEPSTAPFTPPAESVHLTNPSSPEVPFAQFLTNALNANYNKDYANEFHSYQFYPGSPIGNLISPTSARSGSSSPFPDLEFQSNCGGSSPLGEPPQILSPEGVALRKLTPQHAREDSLLDGHISAVAPTVDTSVGLQHDEHSGDVASSLRKSSTITGDATSESSQVAVSAEEGISRDDADKRTVACVDDTNTDLLKEVQPSVVRHASKEFKFDKWDGSPGESSVASDWWVNEKKTNGAMTEPLNNWPFSYRDRTSPGVS